MIPTDDQLKARWKTADGQKRLAAVLKSLGLGQDWEASLIGFAYSTDDCRRDLRGIEINAEDYLDGAKLYGAKLSKADLSDAHLSGAKLHGADLSGAKLSRANLKDALLCGVNLSGAKLRGANLQGANLSGVNLSGADLCGADLHGANLQGADLQGAKFEGANFTGTDFTEVKLKGLVFQATDFTGTVFNRADLSKADLTQSCLFDADLRNADLRGACLEHAYLRFAKLDEADLSGANLSGADLTEASFDNAILSEADLTGCKMLKAKFNGSDISGATVFGVSVWGLELDDNTKQNNLLITDDEEPEITVDDIRVAQFIYLLLNNPNIRDVIDTVAKKVVLILGRFTPERIAVLDAIRAELRARGYCPVLFDFEKPATRDITETVSTRAHMARFVIADLSDPRSIPHELMSFAEKLPSVAVQPLILKGQREYGMFEHFKHYPWVLPVHEYADQASLITDIGATIIDPVETKVRELIGSNP